MTIYHTHDHRKFIIEQDSNGNFAIDQDCWRNGRFSTIDELWNPTPMFATETDALRYLMCNEDRIF